MSDETPRPIPADGEVYDLAMRRLTSLFPVDGPYGHGRTTAASELARAMAGYLDHATRSPDGLPGPATAERVWADLADVMATVGRLLGQTSHRFDELARQPDAYTNGEGPGGDGLSPAGAALSASAYLGQAGDLLGDVVTALRQAARFADRISLHDPTTLSTEETPHGDDLD